MEIQRKSAADWAKEQLTELKKGLPKNWRKLYFEKFPEYNTREGSILVNDVFNLRSTDMVVFENIKSLLK